MTDQRELGRMLRAFFEEGPDELSDRVIDAALDVVDHTQQRPAVRNSWRLPTTGMSTRLAVAAVIGVLAVAGTLVLVPRGQPGVGGPGPTPGASASPSPSLVAVPGKATYVVGTERRSVTAWGTSSGPAWGTPIQAGDVIRLRGRVVASVATMDDPRVTGTATITASLDKYQGCGGQCGPQWGTYRLENAGGAWEGRWTGALWTWYERETINVAGWLVGSGEYEGWTYYLHVWGTGNPYSVEGVIYPGSPPTTAALPAWSPSPSSSPRTSPLPAVGPGPAQVTGTGTISITGGTPTLVGDVWRYRDSAITSDATRSDPRVSGRGSGRLDNDVYGTVGPQWGTSELENAGGAWAGTLAGGFWDWDLALARSDLTFWFVGSGAYAGYTYYQHVRVTGTSEMVEGIIFPGPPPTP